jgi:hypothetical protein
MSESWFKFEPVTIGKFLFKDVEYHRNGITGEGFYCAIANDKEAGGDMLIVYFKEIDKSICCAAFKIDLLPNIQFGINSWRGDRYVSAMKEAIASYRLQFDNYYLKQTA